jgi:alkanesulfonate monooxygenase SsuD/methylene tetrahydromethanopterin reductase-like flavin-dependent oxidoreductase (luciferase family)
MTLSYSLSLENRPAAIEGHGFEHVLRLAEAADDGPFDAVFVNDSIVDTPGYEPLATLGAVAARTRRVRIGTAILQPHFRNPVLLALAWATLDHASGGRTILGLGIGGGAPEHIERECAEFGVRRRDRGAVLERTIEELRALWEGRHERVELPIRPLQERVPIWIASGIYVPAEAGAAAQSGATQAPSGSFAPGRLDRVARLADGWLTIMATPADIRDAARVLDRELAAAGRAPHELTRCLEVFVNVGDDEPRCFREIGEAVSRYFGGAFVPEDMLRRWSIWGSPQACRERLAQLEAAGITHVKLVVGAPDAFRQIDRLAREVLPG